MTVGLMFLFVSAIFLILSIIFGEIKKIKEPKHDGE
jgi:hypothetical protein